MTIHVGSIVLATAWHAPKTLMIAAGREIVAIEIGPIWLSCSIRSTRVQQ